MAIITNWSKFTHILYQFSDLASRRDDVELSILVGHSPRRICRRIKHFWNLVLILFRIQKLHKGQCKLVSVQITIELKWHLVYMFLLDISVWIYFIINKNAWIPVGCVPSTAVTVFPAMHPRHACPPAMHTPPAMHAPCHTCPPAMHAPLPVMAPCHTWPLPCMPHHACPLPHRHPAMNAPCKACPLPHTPPAMHAPLQHMPHYHAWPPAMHTPRPLTPPPLDRMSDACENITFPQLLLRTLIMVTYLIFHNKQCSSIKEIIQFEHHMNDNANTFEL